MHGLRHRELDVQLINEVWDSDIYQKEVRVQLGDIVVDAGAQIGIFTVKVAKTAKKVIAFEPEPNNFELLHINTRPYENVEVHQQALWSETTYLTLHHNPCHPGAHSVISLPPGLADYTVEVEAVVLDDITEDVDFIKMDIEGSEIEALKGGRRLIERCHPVIVMETHPIEPLEEWWRNLFSSLIPYGYEMEVSKPLWCSRIVTARVER